MCPNQPNPMQHPQLRQPHRTTSLPATQSESSPPHPTPSCPHLAGLQMMENRTVFLGPFAHRENCWPRGLAGQRAASGAAASQEGGAGADSPGAGALVRAKGPQTTRGSAVGRTPVQAAGRTPAADTQGAAGGRGMQRGQQRGPAGGFGRLRWGMGEGQPGPGSGPGAPGVGRQAPFPGA